MPRKAGMPGQKNSPASAFSLIINCISQASAFRQQGQQRQSGKAWSSSSSALPRYELKERIY
jgi:hypothetical protein